jgi:DNA repair protein SbcD/Mre11
LNDAIRVVIKNSEVREDERNLLVAHQFFISKDEELLLGGSETCVPTVGGIDSVSSDVLMPFDYVALGHIHRPQKVGRETVRYFGSPLKYSESEYLNNKSMVMVDIKGKDDVSVELIPLEPKRDLRVIEGTVEQLREASKDGSLNNDDYVYVKLTEDAVDAKASLNTVYSNILAIDLLRLSSSDQDLPQIDVASLRSLEPSEIFGDLFRTVNGKDMTDRQKNIFNEAVEKVREGLE